MSQLFNRQYNLSVNIRQKSATGVFIKPVEILVINKLRIQFSIEKSKSGTPNSGTISVFNLNPDNRSKLQEAESLGLSLSAGYTNSIKTIYVCEVSNLDIKKQGPDIMSTFTCGDGLSFLSATANKSYAPETGVRDIIRDLFRLAQLSGVDIVIENLDKITNFKLGQGFVASGFIFDSIDILLNDEDLEMSIQDGKVQIIEAGREIKIEKVVLNKDTGLVGKPEALENGGVKFSSLLNGEIFPGRLVEIESESVNGLFIAEKTPYVGDTRGEDWHIKDAEGVAA